jgi:hypothetical protein
MSSNFKLQYYEETYKIKIHYITAETKNKKEILDEF